jgi:formyltetrahydrofolate synthetase
MIAFPPDIEIAQSAPIRHIRDIASKLGIKDDQLEYYGKYKAKLPLSLIDEKKIEQHHLILVTAMTPTPAGEGKTTISIGLTDGLNKIGKRATAVLREPSLGPVFGMKGGAAGGGLAQVIPMEDINLHFTGDFAAVADVEAVEKGLVNLEKHIENVRKFNLNPVVAINAFAEDSEEEIEMIKEFCSSLGVKAILSTAFSDGGDGAVELAKEVVDIIHTHQSKFQPLYDWNISVEEKIHCIATELYGAKTVEYSVKAKQGLKLIKDLGFDHMPVCMAKTPKSLSDDEKKLGRPKDFIVTVREFEFASGAGFVIPILGDIMRMPGLPLVPAGENVDIDSSGRVIGLF